MEFGLEKSIEILERTPKILESFLFGLSDEWLYGKEGSDTWSAFDVVGHLIHGEKTDWIERLNIILIGNGNKTFQPFDRFAQFEASKGKTINELLNEFTELRVKNLERLKSMNISEVDFKKEGKHPELGVVTLKNLLATWVAHDLGHIAQIARVMAKQYKTEVGPWTAYLGVLNR